MSLLNTARIACIRQETYDLKDDQAAYCLSLLEVGGFVGSLAAGVAADVLFNGR